MKNAVLAVSDVRELGTVPLASNRWRVLGVLSALMGFASISTDLYLPAIPAMDQALHAGRGMMEWTVSGYLIGFSLVSVAKYLDLRADGPVMPMNRA